MQVNAGCQAGTGRITLGADTTLAVSSNANKTLTMPAIALPADGTATLRLDGTRLKSGDHVIMSSGATADSVNHLAVTGDALDGRRYTLTESDGALVLDIVPNGLVIQFR